MEESKKKVMMAVIVVVCFVAAGVMTWKYTLGSDEGTIKIGDKTIWLKCRNPECEHAWQMDLRKFLDHKREQLQAKGPGQHPVTCPTCGEEFPRIQSCGCQDTSELLGLYLDEDLKEGNQVAICNAWGCLRSRIMDRFQLISKC